MIKLNFIRKLGLFFISLLGFIVSVGIPLGYLTHIIVSNAHVAEISRLRVTTAGVAIIALLTLVVVYVKWIRKIFHRKLQALAIINELGMYSNKPIFWNRFLKTLEYIVPPTISLLLFHMMSQLFISEMFDKLVKLNIMFIGLLLMGSIIYLIGDYVKVGFMNKQNIENELDKTTKKDKLLLKRVNKGSRKEREALKIQKELIDLRDEIASEEQY